MNIQENKLINYLLVGSVMGVVLLGAGLAVMKARVETRDIARVAHIREIQMGLELYFQRHGTYPVTDGLLALGEPTTACLSEDGFTAPCSDDNLAPYLRYVPSPPLSGLRGRVDCSDIKNTYCYSTDGQTFRVSFELEKANNILGLERGANCATEETILPGECQSYADSNEVAE